MRLRTLLAALVCATVPGSVPAAAQDVRSIDVPQTLAGKIAAVKKRSTVPVLLPQSIDVGVDTVYPGGGAQKRGWSMSLAAGPRCGGANACFIADFFAERGGKLPAGEQRVKLRGGVTGAFRDISCGASCAPANIWFRRKGVLYQFQYKPIGPARKIMVSLANSALAAGSR